MEQWIWIMVGIMGVVVFGISFIEGGWLSRGIFHIPTFIIGILMIIVAVIGYIGVIKA